MKRVISSLLSNPKHSSNGSKHRRKYPRVAEEYDLIEECGKGASGLVFRASCRAYKEIVAVKQINLETVQAEVETFVSETQTMSQLHHPNLLPLHCCFMHKENLWMVMPYVSGGSLQDILKYKFPQGLSEQLICTVMCEALKGLDYLHKQKIIHRDIKAGNILVGQSGQVWLADFGIAATTNRTGSWGKGGVRNTFAGTICWMAPEVMCNEDYDEKADIWSLGITMLELAYGNAPFAGMTPMKVLMTVMHDDPPRLDDDEDRGRAWSKYFKDCVARCLVKESEQRPSAEELLKHKFFKGAAGRELVQEQLVDSVPDAATIKAEVKTRVQQRLEEMKSQDNYYDTVTNWNFDLSSLKHQLPPLSPSPSGGLEPSSGTSEGVSPTCSSMHSGRSLEHSRSRTSTASTEAGGGRDWALPQIRSMPNTRVQPAGGADAAAGGSHDGGGPSQHGRHGSGGGGRDHHRALQQVPSSPSRPPGLPRATSDLRHARLKRVHSDQGLHSSGISGGGVIINGQVLSPGPPATGARPRPRTSSSGGGSPAAGAGQRRGRFVVVEEGGGRPRAHHSDDAEYREKLLREQARLRHEHAQHARRSGDGQQQRAGSSGGGGRTGQRAPPPAHNIVIGGSSIS